MDTAKLYPHIMEGFVEILYKFRYIEDLCIFSDMEQMNNINTKVIDNPLI